MAKNRGKDFEVHIRQCFEKVPGMSIDRIPDQTMKHKGACNICDFIAYKYPYQYYFECKTVHGNTLSIHSNNPKHKYGNITNTQWEGLLAKAPINGVCAGIICWWVDKDITRFIPIRMLEDMKSHGYKSIRYDVEAYNGFVTFDIPGKKKRVFFDYDIEEFLNDMIEYDEG